MADEFDSFLKASLAPGERLPDRRFVARVQGAIALEERLARQRRALAASLTSQLAALVAVAAGVWVIGRAEPVAEWLTSTPAIGLAIVIGGFTAAVALFAARPDSGSIGRFAPLMMLNGG